MDFLTEADMMAGASEAEKALKQGRIRTAKLLYEQLAEAFPEHGIMLNYGLGCVYRSEVGNGTKAREYFQKALKAPSPVEGENETVKTVQANAIENLMVLSLSFEEFNSWAEKLADLQPDNPIFQKHVPDVKKRQEEGASWATMMDWQAHSFFNADPARDQGHYAEAAATFELLLNNRESLRVSQADYRNSTIVYTGLKLKTVVKHGTAMERAFNGASDCNETLFIMDDAVPLVQQYSQENPDDAKAKEFCGHFMQCYAEHQALSRNPKRPLTGPGGFGTESSSRSARGGDTIKWKLANLGVTIILLMLILWLMKACG